MSELEERLGAILSNPQMMQQIMNLAQTMSASEQSSSSQAPTQAPPPSPSVPAAVPASAPLSMPPEIDLSQIKALAGLANQGIDRNQQALLRALGPYVSKRRVEKLEKAMRASRMAAFASGLIQSGALRSLSGR